jgi:hypothetical protein
MSVRPQWDPKSARKPKVGEFQVPVLVNQKVLGFQVAMEHTTGMTVFNASDQLVQVLLFPK